MVAMDRGLMTIRRGWIAAALLALAAAGAARAQTIQVEIGADQAVVGEPVSLTATVTGVDETVKPQPPQSKDFQIRLANPNPGRRQFMSDINGKVTQRIDYIYQYEFKGQKKGPIVIPPFTINVNGKIIRSNRQSITIGAGVAGPMLVVEVEATKGSVYVGQSIDVALQIWVRKYRQGNFVLSADQMWTVFRQLSANESSLGIFTQADFNRPTVREAQRADDDGVPRDFYIYRLELTVNPTKAGAFEWGPIEIAYNYPLQLTRDVFDRLSIQRSMRLRESPTLPALQVKPVPEDGRPAGYNGAVGRYRVNTSARPTNVPVGDPITLSLTVRGNGALEALSAPRLDQIAELTRDFEVPAEALAGNVVGAEKVFTQTIRPRREDVKEVPPIPFSYFDPDKEQFFTAVSAAFPLKVRPAERAAPIALPETGAAAASPIAELSEGLEANEDDPARLLADRTVGIGPGSWAALGLFPIGYVVLSIFHARSARYRNDVALRRRAWAVSAARKALRGAATPDSAAAAVLTYVADCCNVPAGGLTRGDAVRLMTERGVPTATVQGVDAFLGELEAARYGGGGAASDGGGHADRARGVIDQLEAAGWR